MNKNLKKNIVKIHLWLGLASGIVVVILGITGCIYVFEEELRPIVHKHYFVEEVKKSTLPLSELSIIANDTLQAITQKSITLIEVDSDSNRSVLFRQFDIDKTTKSIWYWDEIKIMDIYLNPYNGDVINSGSLYKDFFQVVLILHWSLLLKNDIGQPIVGIATIIFVITLITGLVLWWPKNKAARKQRVWFKWKNTTKWKRKNYDLHNILGFYSMVFTLVIALTGLVWAFDWFDNSVQWVANGGKTIEQQKEKIVSDTTQFALLNPLDKIYVEVKTNHPIAESYFIYLPQDTIAAQRVLVNYKGRVNDVYLSFDQYTGELLDTESWDDNNNGEKIRGLNYDIHTGGILGFPGKVLAFCLSLIAASLPITGFLIWWGRKKKKKPKK